MISHCMTGGEGEGQREGQEGEGKGKEHFHANIGDLTECSVLYSWACIVWRNASRCSLFDGMSSRVNTTHTYIRSKVIALL